MKFSEYIIYVDESGDHGLTTIDRDFPLFVLDFCIFRKDHYIYSVVPMVQNFKFTHFGHDGVILHEHEIRKQKPPFVFLQNKNNRSVFMNGLNQIIHESDFTIVAAAIDKQRLANQYQHPENPYDIALLSCIERTYSFLIDINQQFFTTHIVVEKRGKREDESLELIFQKICNGWNQWNSKLDFEIVFADKKTNSVGLQLADLTARPIARHILDPQQPNRAFEIIEKKMRRRKEGEKEDWGLIIFP